ncbi:U3 small nucleolar ribonucleoprotein protein IMP4-like [Sycon ciliatum]|uniref:U3 small nucleolar ribonucleoprotein protein IMP4-like n=1 Tax=Sycon ciliatum TaxID=27933 RepID=UPI0031F6D390|eukprot:scpid33989/ scgid1649/ U3 small nucleolar ribonucleoprotein protein IMP4; Brix domain-containing protein 4
MIRRQARLRREYLYRKSLEDQEKRTHDRKKALKAALDSGKPIPTELRQEAEAIHKSVQYTDADREEVHDHVDDEYAFAGVEDPKLVITTSHDPSSKLKQFCKEMCLVFPNCQRLNRGNHVVGQLVEACRANNVTDLIIVHEHRGEPDGLVVSHLPFGPTASFTLSDTVMRHDTEGKEKMSQVFPHLVFDGFSSKLGSRVKDILKYLFPVPKEDSRRIITFSNDSDYILFRHHTYKKKDGKTIELDEVGPRLQMRLFQIRLGTIDQTDADMEWKLRPYMNTAKKRKHLSTTED